MESDLKEQTKEEQTAGPVKETYLEVLPRTNSFNDLALMACVQCSPKGPREEGRHCANWPVGWNELNDL